MVSGEVSPVAPIVFLLITIVVPSFKDADNLSVSCFSTLFSVKFVSTFCLFCLTTKRLVVWILFSAKRGVSVLLPVEDVDSATVCACLLRSGFCTLDG